MTSILLYSYPEPAIIRTVTLSPAAATFPLVTEALPPIPDFTVTLCVADFFSNTASTTTEVLSVIYFDLSNTISLSLSVFIFPVYVLPLTLYCLKLYPLEGIALKETFFPSSEVVTRPPTVDFIRNVPLYTNDAEILTLFCGITNLY